MSDAETMKDEYRVMQLVAPGMPLAEATRPMPQPAAGQVLVRVEACGVCRTDLHVADGELPQARYPIVPGHEVVGTVEDVGAGVTSPAVGERIGVPWLGRTCGRCDFCLGDRENLCDAPEFIGCTLDGGFATHMLADAAYCLRLGDISAEPASLAPLLCAGLIGWRAFRAAGPCRDLGLYGFGAAAHILCQMAVARGVSVYAFTRPGDGATQAFARSLGACWAGGSDDAPPHPLDATIIFAPVGALVPIALGRVRKGGRVVCAGIHMSDIPGFEYRRLWGERELVSVANLTREDGRTFFLAAGDDVRTRVRTYPLRDANLALEALREGSLSGAAVIVPD
ncbi:propanol-preferring alcohol dehydrogenase [Dokdonella fugitiva]|jgi:propanol-preferring alcohol dehydrogenase|uniref:Propanol-preferring alcohol dehydrogenase n=2 Tax=Dokdonella fugitiva TaxID=328517 RepID=A0A4R2I9A0_9GAMM|nr:propanol-preferring alcohol dehydrogenase [Dokdonella fugitiva]